MSKKGEIKMKTLENMKNFGKKSEVVKNRLQNKLKNLQEIINSKDPKNYRFNEAHAIKVERASKFFDELAEVSSFVEDSFDIRLVPLETIDKQIEKADFATIEFEGEYCKLVLVQNFPYDDLWLLYTAPIKSINGVEC